LVIFSQKLRNLFFADAVNIQQQRLSILWAEIRWTDDLLIFWSNRRYIINL